MFDRAERAFVAAARFEALVLRGGVVGLDADRGDRGFFEREVEPFGAVAGLARAALAGRLVVAGTLAGVCPMISTIGLMAAASRRMALILSFLPDLMPLYSLAGSASCPPVRSRMRADLPERWRR